MEFNVPDDWHLHYHHCAVCNRVFHSSGRVNGCECTKEKIDAFYVDRNRSIQKKLESMGLVHIEVDSIPGKTEND